ncbi:MAG: SpoIIE family protein phosphatase, partial [Candidatus Eisenbacteria bacterium]|nr:SpoIIE family protein phosphatase [Candidatus Eisenbacteria bacterium]
GHVLRAGGAGAARRLVVERGDRTLPVVFVPGRLPPREIGWGIATAAAALAALFVGTMALVRRPRQLTAVFFLICLALSMLLFFPYVPPVHALIFAANVAKTLLNAFVPALFVRFFLLFPYERPVLRESRTLRTALLVLPILLFTLDVLSSFDPWPSPGAAAALATIAELATTIAYAAAFGFSIVLFASAYRRTAAPSVRRKLRVALVSTAAAVLPVVAVILLHALLPGREIPFDRVAALGIVWMPVGFGYAIVKHGVFDIERIVKRGLVLSGITAALVLLYFLSYFLLRALLHSVTALSGTLISILSFLFVVVLFSPIREMIQEIVDRSLYPERFASRRSLVEFARSLPLLADQDQILRASLARVASALGVRRGAFFSEDEPLDQAAFSWGIEGTEETAIRLPRLLREPVLARGEPLLREEVEAELPRGYLPPEEDQTLGILEARALVPVVTGPHRFGVAVLGPRADGDTYSVADLEILDSLMSQTALAMENARFQRELRVKEAMQRELEVAHTLQQQLLPRRAPSLEGIEMVAETLPCEELGGDYFDYLRSEGGHGRLSFAVGDVSGSGVPAAILMANVQALFRAEARGGAEPNEILFRMNQRLCEIERPDRFVSFFCAQMDEESGEIRYSSAGHPPPLLVRRDGRIEHLSESALLLGIQAGTSYPIARVRLSPGDLLLCFTDGIPDPLDEKDSFREDHLEALAVELRHLPSGRILDRMMERVRAKPTREDDVTVLIVKALATEPARTAAVAGTGEAPACLLYTSDA